MAVTQDEIESFARFAKTKLANGFQLELEDCLRLWRDEQETVASVERGAKDIEAGRCQTLDEADAEIRQEFGFPPRT